MFSVWVATILAVVAIESITEIIIDSRLFKPMRRKIKKKWRKISEAEYQYSKIERRVFFFLNAWVSCGYCLSYVVSAVAALFVAIRMSGYPLVDFFFTMFILGRLANWLHEFTQIVSRGRVKYVNVTHEIQLKEDEGDSKYVGPESKSI